MSSHRRMYTRLRSVCCRFWSIPPWEFDAAVERGDVKARDVLELFVQLTHDPVAQIWVVGYVHPDAIIRAENREKRERWRALIEKTARAAMNQKAARESVAAAPSIGGRKKKKIQGRTLLEKGLSPEPPPPKL